MPTHPIINWPKPKIPFFKQKTFEDYDDHDKLSFSIQVTMKKRWIPHFLSMLSYMQFLGRIGSSRQVSFYSDGDGDFQPIFKWDETLPSNEKPIEDSDGDRIYDAG